MPRHVKLTNRTKILPGDVLLWRGIELEFQRDPRRRQPYWWGSHPLYNMSAELRVAQDQWEGVVWIGAPGNTVAYPVTKKGARTALEESLRQMASGIESRWGFLREIRDSERVPIRSPRPRRSSWDVLIGSKPVV